jgi:hypothetical protein
MVTALQKIMLQDQVVLRALSFERTPAAPPGIPTKVGLLLNIEQLQKPFSFTTNNALIVYPVRI